MSRLEKVRKLQILQFFMLQCAKIIKEAMEEKYGGMGFWQVRERDGVLVLLVVF